MRALAANLRATDSIRLAWAAGLSSPRVLLFFIAIVVKLLASSLSAAGFVLAQAGLSSAGSLSWLVWFAILFVIALPQTDRVLERLVSHIRTAAVIAFGLLLLFGLVESVALVAPDSEDRLDWSGSAAKLATSFKNMVGYNDATALTDQATHNLISGKNPYTSADIVEALQGVNDPSTKTTPLREGQLTDAFPYPSEQQLQDAWQDAQASPGPPPAELESKVTYPAGSFLIPAPFMAAGMGDLRWTYLLLVLASVGLTLTLVRGDFRFVFVAAAVASLELWNCVVTGDTGLVYFAFLLPAWVLLKRNLWWSALFFGIAVAAKQQAWFFVPFYLIALFHTFGWKRLFAAAGLISGVFLAANAYFMVQDLHLWTVSVLAPVLDRMFPMGVGAITTVTTGFLDIRSPLLFLVLEVAALLGGAVWYCKNFHRYPIAGPLLAIIPFFFAWRSLWNYFYYADIIVLALLLTESWQPAKPAVATK